MEDQKLWPVWHLPKILLKGEGLNQKLKRENAKLGEEYQQN